MATPCTITISDNFGTGLTVFRAARGYPDGPDGVLETLRLGFDLKTETRPRLFDARAFRRRLLAAWRAAGIEATAVVTPAPGRGQLFHYDVLPSRGADNCLFVRVSVLEDAGREAPRFVPVHGFLVFPTRCRRTDRPLSRADEFFAVGRDAVPALRARVERAAELSPPMLGQQANWLVAGFSTLALAGFLEAGERADADTVRAFEERGARALRRGGRELVRAIRG